MLRVHEESGITGAFRIHRGKLECEVRVVVKRWTHHRDGHARPVAIPAEVYRSWREATDQDCVLAAVVAEGGPAYERAYSS